MLTPRRGLPELLGHPDVCGMGSDGRMHNAPGGQLDDDEDEDGSEEEVVHLCEVAGPDLIGMVPQKGSPVLVGGRGCGCGVQRQIALDGALTDLDTQLEEFAADAFGAPGHVFRSHLFDQGDGFGRDPGLRRFGFGLAAPDQTEQLTMPAQQGVRLNDEKGLLPEGRRPGQEQEPESIPIAESGVFDLALKDDQLLSQEGVLGDELGLAADRILGGSCKQRDGVGLEAVPYSIADLVGDVEDLGSEATEDSEHDVDGSRNLAMRPGGYQSSLSESSRQSAQIRTDESSSQHA